MTDTGTRLTAAIILLAAACQPALPARPTARGNPAASREARLLAVRRLTAASLFQSARPVAEKLVGDYPNDPQAHLAYAELLRAMGMATQASAEYSRAEILDPRLAEPAIALARLNLESLNLELSLHYARDAVSRAPASLPAHLVLAQALLSSDRLTEADQEIRRLLLRYPRTPAVLFLAYRLNRQRGSFGSARSYLEQAIAGGRPEPRWLYELADLLEIAGDCRAAARCLLELTALQPDSEQAREKLASVYEFTCHDYDRAIAQYRLIVRSNPDSVTALAGIDRCQSKKNDLAFELKVLLHRLWGELAHLLTGAPGLPAR